MLYYVRKLVNISLLLMYRILYRIIQTDKKTVLFMSFHGRSFSDNPRALYQEMKQQDRFSDFTYVWVVRDASMRIEGAKTVKFGSLTFFYYLAKSRYWIFNCKTYPFMIRKKDQVYLQTWHGTPLKRLAHDIQISSDAKFYRVERDNDDGRAVYEVEFYSGNTEYDYEISAETGEILSYDSDIEGWAAQSASSASGGAVTLEHAGRTVNAKQSLELMMLGVRSGQHIVVRVEGPDETTAGEAIRKIMATF